MTSLLTELQASQEASFHEPAFHKTVWRKHGAFLGKVNLDLLADLTLDTLYGLAAEECVESRVIEQAGEEYHLTLGPFEPGELGSSQMLMVQNLESFLPAVSDWLASQFSFLPRWRIEDVMATVAHDGGNCGPHFDQYDVFLVQLRGEKAWSLDEGAHGVADLSLDAEIRLLEHFDPSQTLTQVPGDVLYVPPGVGHHGIASDNCITLSIGIRNPLLSEMTSYLADLLILESGEGTSLNDQLLGTEIEPREVSKLGAQLAAALTEPSLMNQWYGCYMTEPRDPELLRPPQVEIDGNLLTKWLSTKNQLHLDLPTRIAVQGDTLFVNGQAIQIGRRVTWLNELQQQRCVSVSQIGNDLDVIVHLLESGALADSLP